MDRRGIRFPAWTFQRPEQSGLSYGWVVPTEPLRGTMSDCSTVEGRRQAPWEWV